MVSPNPNSPTIKVIEAVLTGRIVPLYNDEILSEYLEVLHRTKFNLLEVVINNVVGSIVKMGLFVGRLHTDEPFTDPKDVIFFETALSVEGSYVVTGNLKHFPKSPIVITPAEMVKML